MQKIKTKVYATIEKRMVSGFKERKDSNKMNLPCGRALDGVCSRIEVSRGRFLFTGREERVVLTRVCRVSVTTGREATLASGYDAADNEELA